MHDLKKSGFFGLSDLCRYQSGEGWGLGHSWTDAEKKCDFVTDVLSQSTMRLPGARDKVGIVNLFTYF